MNQMSALRPLSLRLLSGRSTLVLTRSFATATTTAETHPKHAVSLQSIPSFFSEKQKVVGTIGPEVYPHSYNKPGFNWISTGPSPASLARFSEYMPAPEVNAVINPFYVKFYKFNNWITGVVFFGIFFGFFFLPFWGPVIWRRQRIALEKKYAPLKEILQ